MSDENEEMAYADGWARGRDQTRDEMTHDMKQLEVRLDHENRCRESAEQLAAERLEQINCLAGKLPRWRIAADEKPTADGEYIVARREEVFGDWRVDLGRFELEGGDFGIDDDGMRVLLWMPNPEMPK